MRVLALDLSTKSSGQAIFENQELVEYDCITSASTNLYTRIDKMVEGISAILTTEKIDKVIIEEVLPDDV